MTLEEAKKILKKEGYDVEKAGGSGSPSIIFTEYESPEICEAMQVVCSAGYGISMVSSCFMERKARLSLELAENSDAPVSGKEQSKEGNPALKEAATQFNDALLDEQAKKIEELTRENEDLKSYNEMLDQEICLSNIIIRDEKKRLGKEISKLNSIIHDKNEELKRKTKGCCELITENVDLKKKLSDKDAVLADVAEELRLSKIREKNLTELCQKYIKANEELKEKLADKIDAQALKSAESALAYKDSYIEKLKNKKVINNRASMEAIAKYVDAVSKAEQDGLVLVSWKNDGKEITSVYQLKNGKRYTLSLVYTGEEFLFYKTDLDKKRHISTPEISQEELMKIQEKVVASFDIAEEGGDNSGVIVLCGKDFIKKLKEYEDFLFDLLEYKAKEAPSFNYNDPCSQMNLTGPIQKNKSVK